MLLNLKKTSTARVKAAALALPILVAACDQEKPTLGQQAPGELTSEQNIAGSSSSAATLWLAPGRMPSQAPLLSLTAQSESVSTEAEQPKIMDQQESEVCQGTSFRDATGAVRQGKKICQLAACTSQQSVDCKAVEGFATIDRAQLSSSTLVSGYQIAGVDGSFDLSQYRDCTASGEQNCTIGQGFVAVAKSLVAGKNIKLGTQITSQLVGSFPSANAELPNTPINSTQLTPSNFKAALSSTNRYHFYDSAGNPHTITGDANLAPANLYATVTAYGVKGTASLSNLNSCNGDGQTSCLASTSYFALKKSLLRPDIIKKTITIGGVQGTYPSLEAPLLGSTAVADLMLNTYGQLASDTRFEYFDHTGARYEQAGDSNLNPSNIALNTLVLGVTGSYKGVNYGAYDGYDFRFGVSIPTQDKGGLDLTGYCTTAENCRSTYWRDLSKEVNSNDSDCSSTSKTCLFRSKITRLQWQFPMDGQPLTFEQAMSYCTNSNLLGKTDWRLGTQKEVMQAAINGIDMLGHYGYYQGRNTADRKFWTATADHSEANKVRRATYDPINQIFGGSEPNTTNRHEVMCMRVLDSDAE